MNDVAQKPKIPRWIKVAIWTASLLVAYTVIGFFIVPAIVKSQMVKRLPPITKRQAAVRQVAFNPFTLALSIRGLALTETNGETFAGWEEFHVEFQAMASIFHLSWVFHDVTLNGPFAHVIRLKDGSFNFDNLIQTNAAAPAKPGRAPALPAVVVESLRIAGASLRADDMSPAAAFHDTIAPINVELTNFTVKINAASPFVIVATTDADESFALTGHVTVQPVQVSGNIKIAGLDLKRYNPYLPPFTKAEVAGGKLDVGADYQLAIGASGLDATVTNGIVQLTGLRVKSPDSGETVVSIPTFTLNLAEASLAKKLAHVSSIKSSGGALLVRQNHDGTINLLNLLVANAATVPAPAGTNGTKGTNAPWTAEVDEIAFDGYSFAVEDQKPAHPAKLDVSALAFTVKGFNSASNPPLPTAVSMHINGKGTLSIHGTVAPAPLSADLAVDLAGLDLPPFAPYLPENVRLLLSSGRLNVQGRAVCAVKPDGPEGTFAGDVSVEDFAAADVVHDSNLAKFDALKVTGIKASYPALKLQVQEVALVNFNANAVIDTNGQINLLTVLATNAPGSAAAPAPAPASASASAPAPAPQIDLGALVIDKAAFHFIDESLEPHATFDLQELSGSIKGISSQPQGPAKVDFRGSVDQFSPFTISGSVDPLAKDITLDVAVSFKNVELTSMSPYMEKFGGYPLNKGKLMLQLNYDVVQRKLAATNQVEIDNLTLGAKNNSTNATHLPIKLGIALLKDREGKISLDVPVAGSLDDPKFKLGAVIWGVVENLLAKAATSPFTLLGKVLGGSEQDLSCVEFAAGEAVLAPSEKAKIQNLSKALYERPALTLQIAGDCAPALDRPVLARREVQRRINRMWADKQVAAGLAAPSVESIQLEPADYARFLQKLYVQTFGTNLAAVVGGPVLEKTAEAPHAPAVAKGNSRGVDEFAKGGERMMRQGAAHPVRPMAAGPTVAKASQGQPPGGAAPGAPDMEQMEQRLAAEMPVTEDELRDLEQMRARAAQSALLESGQIAAERVFIVAPKPINAAATGAARDEFSLE